MESEPLQPKYLGMLQEKESKTEDGIEVSFYIENETNDLFKLNIIFNRKIMIKIRFSSGLSRIFGN